VGVVVLDDPVDNTGYMSKRRKRLVSKREKNQRKKLRKRDKRKKHERRKE